MTSAQCRIFSQIAAESRASCQGQTGYLTGTTLSNVTITLVCQPLNNLELAAGGFEQQGSMKALIYGATIPSIHDRISISSKTWVVKSKIENLSSVETALLLEAIPA